MTLTFTSHVEKGHRVFTLANFNPTAMANCAAANEQAVLHTFLYCLVKFQLFACDDHVYLETSSKCL